jgi:hypothetical protein
MRRLIGAIGLCVLMACSSSTKSVEVRGASVNDFAGAWKSVTPPVEFIRLTLVSLSSQEGVIGARMTFSGVAWEGSGRIEGDSLRIDMTMAGSSTSVGSVVIHSTDAQTIRVQTRPALVSSQSALDLTLVREN